MRRVILALALVLGLVGAQSAQASQSTASPAVRAQKAPATRTAHIGKYTVTMPAKPVAKPVALRRLRVGENTLLQQDAVPVPPGAYFHLSQACGLASAMLGYYWANIPSNPLSHYGVPLLSQPSQSYALFRQGGIAFLGDYYRWANTIMQCHLYIGDRANSVIAPNDPNYLNGQNGCDVYMTIGGWDDGGWGLTITGYQVYVNGCALPTAG